MEKTLTDKIKDKYRDEYTDEAQKKRPIRAWFLNKIKGFGELVGPEVAVTPGVLGVAASFLEYRLGMPGIESMALALPQAVGAQVGTLGGIALLGHGARKEAENKMEADIASGALASRYEKDTEMKQPQTPSAGSLKGSPLRGKFGALRKEAGAAPSAAPQAAFRQNPKT